MCVCVCVWCVCALMHTHVLIDAACVHACVYLCAHGVHDTNAPFLLGLELERLSGMSKLSLRKHTASSIRTLHRPYHISPSKRFQILVKKEKPFIQYSTVLEVVHWQPWICCVPVRYLKQDYYLSYKSRPYTTT
jgi:hypothetical protein